MLASGKLIYSEDYKKLIVDVDNNIGKYYRSLIPKYLNVNPPKYSSHISVVRNEIVKNINAWRKYSDIEFEYEPVIFNDDIYFWLPVKSQILKDIRVELGLSDLSEYTKSPDDQHDFHITIGNVKENKNAI